MEMHHIYSIGVRVSATLSVLYPLLLLPSPYFTDHPPDSSSTLASLLLLLLLHFYFFISYSLFAASLLTIKFYFIFLLFFVCVCGVGIYACNYIFWHISIFI